MKRIWLLILPFLPGLSLFGQPKGDRIIHDPLLRTDQAIEYTWDQEKSAWILKNSIKYNYTYENGEVQKITTFDYHSGSPLNQTIYFYTPEKLLEESLFQSYVSGVWVDTRRDLWFYDTEGLTNEAIIQFIRNGIWANSIRYTDFQYDSNRLLQFTYQTWINEQWVNDHFDQWNYDDRGNLVLREQINLIGIPINKFIYVVNENNIRQSMTLYNWGNNRWIENYQYLYETNQCGRTTALVYQVFRNGQWVNSSKQEYIYIIDTENIHQGQKVPICHNGNTIYVSVNAVKAHLAHGDCIGECTVEKKPEKRGFDEKEKPVKPPFIIYPNPAKEKITIKFDRDECKESKRVELTDFNGKTIRSFNVKDNGDLTIYRGNLISGKYCVKLVGKEIYSAVVIFK